MSVVEGRSVACHFQHIFKALLTAFGLLLTASLARGEAASTLYLSTEHFPPYSMTLDGSSHSTAGQNITGSSVDIVRELMQRADQPYELSLVPWKRAYTSALELPQHGVFSTSVTDERRPLFKWVSPLAKGNWVLYARKNSGISITTLEDARQYRIGGYLEDAIANYLELNGFKLDYVHDDVLNLKKLARGRIDLWPGFELKGEAMARAHNIEVERVFVLQSIEFGLALHPDVDQALIDHLNSILQKMHIDGTIENLTQKY